MHGRNGLFLYLCFFPFQVTYLAPEVMAAFVDNFQHRNDLAAVERCLLHMDVAVLDFNSIVSTLRKHRLYSAPTHVYTSGLDGQSSKHENIYAIMINFLCIIFPVYLLTPSSFFCE